MGRSNVAVETGAPRDYSELLTYHKAQITLTTRASGMQCDASEGKTIDTEYLSPKQIETWTQCIRNAYICTSFRYKRKYISEMWIAEQYVEYISLPNYVKQYKDLIIKTVIAQPNWICPQLSPRISRQRNRRNTKLTNK